MRGAGRSTRSNPPLRRRSSARPRTSAPRTGPFVPRAVVHDGRRRRDHPATGSARACRRLRAGRTRDLPEQPPDGRRAREGRRRARGDRLLAAGRATAGRPRCSWPPPRSPAPTGCSPSAARAPSRRWRGARESIARVDRIVGPGNAYVAEAKLQAVGRRRDRRAGRAERAARDRRRSARTPRRRARDGRAGRARSARVGRAGVDVRRPLARAVEREIGRHRAAAQPRAAIIRDALAARGGARDRRFRSTERSPSQRLRGRTPAARAVARRAAVAARVRNAGTIFIGEASSVAFGDYMSGANHVLADRRPRARLLGALDRDFYRWTTTQRVPRAAARSLAADVGTFADAEGLPGHAAAAQALEDGMTRPDRITPDQLPRPGFDSIPRYAAGTPCRSRPERQHQPVGCSAGGGARRCRRRPAYRVIPTCTASRSSARDRQAGGHRSGVRGDGQRIGRRARLRDPRVRGAGRRRGAPGSDVRDGSDLRANQRHHARAGARSPRTSPWTPMRCSRTGARIIYLCSPNNPTASPTGVDAIRHVIAGRARPRPARRGVRRVHRASWIPRRSAGARARRGLPHAVQGLRTRRAARGIRRRPRHESSRPSRRRGARSSSTRWPSARPSSRADDRRGVGRRARVREAVASRDRLAGRTARARTPAASVGCQLPARADAARVRDRPRAARARHRGPAVPGPARDRRRTSASPRHRGP